MWLPDGRRKSDFDQLERVLRKGKPDRPVLFEYYMNERIYDLLTHGNVLPEEPKLRYAVKTIKAYERAGYDYSFLTSPPDFSFQILDRHPQASVSLNKGLIDGWESFESFPWPELDKVDFSYWDSLPDYIPEGMKMIPDGPGGVEENVIEILGYENLCIFMYEEPELVRAVFDRIGQLLVDYYELIRDYPFVGAVISNDDWGFNTQPLISEEQMEEYLYPWHRKISAAIHGAGKPAILHSCGNLYPRIMDTLIDDLGYEAKHSYEDNIMSIEDAYDSYAGRIALLGGIDVDFIIRSSEEEVYSRSRGMLERAGEKGCYALGTGNSVPDYIPDSHYLAMIRAAWDLR
ncbi:MAG: uroporphyrinogen decarboxylase family protein [Spirochaetales bacterium]|nr:uroporphyrinogen decarboxylase family protein [Spirochaetales bacterium]